MIWRIVFLLFGLWIGMAESHAAAFLQHLNGRPYGWDFSSPMTYKVDQGSLRVDPPNDTEVFDNATGTLWVDMAFATWDGVSIGATSFQNGGQLADDVTEDNIYDYVEVTEEGLINNLTNETVIVIFDATGAIFDELFGDGASDFVLGVAAPSTFDDSTLAITQGVALINGKSASEGEIRATMVHEFGHLLNLAHTQLNFEEGTNGSAGDNDVIPTMFPFIPADGTPFLTLQGDDEFSLGYLYPSAAYAARGMLRGKIQRRAGAGIQAVHVNCRNVNDPRGTAVSYVSDQTFEGDGNYQCGNLGTGSYSVDIEPIEVAINFYDPDPPFILWESYSGEDESFDPAIDAVSSASEVAVVEGETSENIDIILNEDGRLQSGTSVTDSTSTFFPPMEFFISVPEGADKVTFELSTPSAADLDLMGRCDSEFSLAIDAGAAPLTAEPGEEQQADFATIETTGNETVVLDSKSLPPLEACTYHLLVVNFSQGSSVDFELVANIEGASPKLLITRRNLGEISDAAGEVAVFAPTFEARQDTYRVRSFMLTDGGTADLGRVSEAKLYDDIDESGSLTEGDRLVAVTTEIDSGERTIRFTDLDEFMEEGAQEQYVVTYVVTGTASLNSLWMILIFAGLLFSFRRSKPVRHIALLCSFVILSCGGEPGPYEPEIQNKDDIEVSGQTFGEDFKIRFDSVSSVKEFFE